MDLAIGENQHISEKLKSTPSPEIAESVKRAKSADVQKIEILPDHADLSPSLKMRVRLLSLKQAMVNISTGITMLQVANGYLGEMESVISRIRVLAIRATNTDETNASRLKLQVHVSQLVDEVNRIASQAEFSYLKLLQGNFAPQSKLESMWIHVGPNMHQRERIYIATMTATALKLMDSSYATISVSAVSEAKESVAVVDEALSRVSKQQTDLHAYIERIRYARDGLKSEMHTLQTPNSDIQNFSDAEKVLNKVK